MDKYDREARELAYFIAANRFGEGAARNAFAEDIRNAIATAFRRIAEEARKTGLEAAAVECEQQAAIFKWGDVPVERMDIEVLAASIRALKEPPNA